MSMIYLLLLILVLSLVLTGCMRHYALVRNIMDIPNDRSSHIVPTPRGGGAAFIVALFMALPCIWGLGFVVLPIGMALVIGGFLVAALGFIDDHRYVPAYLRILGHLGACVFVLYWLGGMPSISVLGYVVPAGMLLNIMAVIYLVWQLNLYNFMDGIDGLAAIEAISVCLSGSFLYWLSGDYGLMGLPLAIAASVAGFLWWNFPSARIFMGDVGSGFLGLALGVLTIQAAGVGQQFFWGWLILLGVFIVDATVTLLVRGLQGCKVYEAHCDHAYQHAAHRLGRHVWVTLSILMLNVFWLLPLAILVNRSILSGSTGLIIAYLPLVIIAIRFRAGRKDEPRIKC